LGKDDGMPSSSEAAPFPFGQDALGSIRVQIWMNGMAAEEGRNRKSAGRSLRAEEFGGSEY
jgi:hypothetical protein